jgi:hypothetical protein
VSAYIPTYGYFPGTDYVTVYLTPISGTTSVTTTAAYAGNDGYYMYWTVSIPKVSNGTYDVQANYIHPVGPGGGGSSKITTISASSGSGHTVNVSFSFP